MDFQVNNPKTHRPAAKPPLESVVKKPLANQALAPESKPRTMTDAEIQALLTVNSLQTVKPAKGSKKVYLYVSMALVLIILVAMTLTLTHTSKNNSSGNSGLPSPTNNPLNNGGSIDQQVQYCSNPVNASLVC